VPFHTTCFDIFIRLSRRHFGYVDINGLMGSFQNEGMWNHVDGYTHHQDVRRSSEQMWRHTPGLEYLATNPLFVPCLDPILRSVIQDEPSFNPENGAFEVPEFHHNPQSPDLFDTLPQELKLEIVRYLTPKVTSNLRLATRAFRQLPISLWRRFLQEEMPWLWEAWSDETPYFWAVISPDILKDEIAAKNTIQTELPIINRVIREEMPELLEDFKNAGLQLLAMRPDPKLEAQAAVLDTLIRGLPTFNTNWYELYSEIIRNWKDLKGLQNRQRIWNDCEQIIQRIKKYHEKDDVME
jgi:hypothetical protein